MQLVLLLHVRCQGLFRSQVLCTRSLRRPFANSGSTQGQRTVEDGLSNLADFKSQQHLNRVSSLRCINQAQCYLISTIVRKLTNRCTQLLALVMASIHHQMLSLGFFSSPTLLGYTFWHIRSESVACHTSASSGTTEGMSKHLNLCYVKTTQRVVNIQY